MINDPEVRQVVDTFQLGLSRLPVAGRTGDLLGRRSGNSLEFQEHRQYLPGDDIRHLDWAAYGRTDDLMVRLYREETSLRTQILLDVSRSTAVGDGAKFRVARQLAAAMSMMVRALGGQPTITLLGDEQPLRQLRGEEIQMLESLQPSGRSSMVELTARRRIPLKPHSARIVISDFLFPHDPPQLIRELAAGSTLFWVVQVLTRFESDPQPIGGRKLSDVETCDETDLRINQVSIARYLTRLRRLQEQLRGEVARIHGCWAVVVAECGLLEICQRDLCKAGILRPR